MAKPNFGFQKRQKELAREAKQKEKEARKAERRAEAKRAEEAAAAGDPSVLPTEPPVQEG